MPKRYKWTVEFEVDEIWVADGFQMTDETAKNMIENWLRYSEPHETGARVIKSPPKSSIEKAGETLD